MSIVRRVYRRALPVLARPLYPFYRGAGVMLSFHRIVRDAERSALGPNRAMETTPEYLERILEHVCREGLAIIRLEDLPAHLAKERPERFVCFTFDDGYKDTLHTALPVLKRYNAPFTTFITPSFIDGTGWPWWYILEKVAHAGPSVRYGHGGTVRTIPTATHADRERFFAMFGPALKAGDQMVRDDEIRRLSDAAGVDPDAATRALIMDRNELMRLSAEPLATIGAHGVRHYAVATLTDAGVREELGGSRAWLEGLLGRPVTTFAYPYDSHETVSARDARIAQELGLTVAVTTLGGNIFRAHRDHCQSLPRTGPSGNREDASLIPWMLRGVSRLHETGFTRVVTTT